MIRPVGLREANAFVERLHRHHGPVRGHKFSVGVEDDRGGLRGVAIAGRPVSRHLDNGRRLEVLRVCTDGAHNACSILYGAVARAGVAMGYRRHDIFTYLLADEDGASLKAAGWVPVAETEGGSWSRPSRWRQDGLFPHCTKRRWHAAEPEMTHA